MVRFGVRGRRLEGVLGASWGLLGGSWVPLGATFDDQKARWKPFESAQNHAFYEVCWCFRILRIFATENATFETLGAIWKVWEASWGRLGCSWGRCWGPKKRPGGVLGRLDASKGPPGEGGGLLGHC